MNKLKVLGLKTLFSGIALALSSVTFSALADSAVSVVSIVEHPALDNARDGVKAALLEAGFDPEKNLTWEFQSAQNNTSTATQIARNFIGNEPNAIVAIGTPSAQAVAAATKEVPLIFLAVTDPVEAQLVPSWEPSGTNITGVSDALELEKQVELIKKVVPNAKNIGIVYNPSEANSAIVVKQLQDILPKHGMSLVEAAAPRTIDVTSAAQSLVGKVDVIYTNTDNNVVSAYESLVKVGNEAKIPLVAADTDSVKRGAIAALGVNYFDLGHQAGKIAVRIINGEKAGDIAPQTSEKVELFLNKTAAKAQGVELSDALIAEAAQVLE
ncbi:ABC transporter substrate-binding protein [Thorsellia anophelis]|uniref:Putative ABC transport system substrate-binding protein n=1 Tax=Thorsellia anophelis DSM 18579 TaxID=1123402 RepID=A0A1I0CTK4_9GAMM|nr:ABC transporter substrate-binding protein [Thorsellia anophelis]SET23093.1 putative ABC transport system substrate-binding protein [Thorsellia anophelis DSM 18579]